MFYFSETGGLQTLRRRLVAPFVTVRLLDLADEGADFLRDFRDYIPVKWREIPEHVNLSTRKLYTKYEWTQRRSRSRLRKLHIGGDIVLVYLSACQQRYRFRVWFGSNWLYVHSTENRGMEVYFHILLTSVLGGAEWETSRQGSFTSRERADY
jgi:hypothetical protein